MEKLLIIDGNNLLFQMYYGMPSKIYNKSGKTIHATIGFVSFVMKQINLYNVTKVVVVFDGDSSSERKELLNEYKGNRIDYSLLSEDNNPFSEEENIKKCLSFLGIKCLNSKNMEADDLIASLTYLFNKNNEIIISSFDSDFFQLIDDNVSILRYRGKNSKMYDKSLFFKEYGFKPNRYVFYKSLLGDISDNIKGVKGVGKKRSALIVNHIDNIDDLSSLKDFIPYKIYQELLDSKQTILLNVKLIKLFYKEEIKFEIEYFDYIKEHLKMTNSMVLSACHIFD